MPRIPSGGRNTNKSNNPKSSAYKDVQRYLGEETDSSSFRSVSTDRNATNYGFDYTTSATNPRGQKRRSARDTSGPSRSGQESSPRRSNRSSTVHRNQPSQSKSPTRAVGRSRKAKSPQKRAARRKPRVLKEIINLQRTTRLLIPKLPFSRVVREIMMNCSDQDMRITPQALEAVQESAELYLTQLFSDSYRCTLHRDRVTLMIKDIQLVRYIRGRNDPGNL